MKPNWDEYFMDMAYFVAQRSNDPSTKCGCVVVDEDNSVLSVGYNNPPRDCFDEVIPTNRPEKYPYYIHSEENCIINAARNGVSLKNSTFYITGIPCSRCFRGIVNVGAKRIIYGPNTAVMCDNENLKIIKLMNKSKSHIGDKVELIPYKGILGKVLKNTGDYMEKKLGNCIIDTRIVNPIK